MTGGADPPGAGEGGWYRAAVVPRGPRAQAARWLTAPLVVASLLVACGREEAASNATPGFRDTPSTVDTTPFSLPEPNKRTGSTTIPVGAPGGGEVIDNTALSPSTPSTTVMFGPPEVPQVAGITSICGFEATVGPFESLAEESPERTEVLFTELVAALGRYVDVGPPYLRGDLEAIRETMLHVRDVLAANGWDPTSVAFTSAVAALIAAASEPNSFAARLQRVVGAERRAC